MEANSHDVSNTKVLHKKENPCHFPKIRLKVSVNKMLHKYYSIYAKAYLF